MLPPAAVDAILRCRLSSGGLPPMSPTKYLLVGGARPNFMKIGPIHRAFSSRRDGHSPAGVLLVHTGQRHDLSYLNEMSPLLKRNLRRLLRWCSLTGSIPGCSLEIICKLYRSAGLIRYFDRGWPVVRNHSIRFWVFAAGRPLRLAGAKTAPEGNKRQRGGSKEGDCVYAYRNLGSKMGIPIQESFGLSRRRSSPPCYELYPSDLRFRAR